MLHGCVLLVHVRGAISLDRHTLHWSLRTVIEKIRGNEVALRRSLLVKNLINRGLYSLIVRGLYSLIVRGLSVLPLAHLAYLARRYTVLARVTYNLVPRVSDSVRIGLSTLRRQVSDRGLAGCLRVWTGSLLE